MYDKADEIMADSSIALSNPEQFLSNMAAVTSLVTTDDSVSKFTYLYVSI